MRQIEQDIADEIEHLKYTPYKRLVFDRNIPYNNLRTMIYVRINNFFLPIFTHVTN